MWSVIPSIASSALGSEKSISIPSKTPYRRACATRPGPLIPCSRSPKQAHISRMSSIWSVARPSGFPCAKDRRDFVLVLVLVELLPDDNVLLRVLLVGGDRVPFSHAIWPVKSFSVRRLTAKMSQNVQMRQIASSMRLAPAAPVL